MKDFCGFFTFVGRHKPYFAMLAIQFVYAGMALFSKASIDKGMNPHIFVVYRQAFASLVLAPFAFFLERKNAPLLSYIILCKIFLVSLCGITLSLNLYYVALNYTTATIAVANHYFDPRHNLYHGCLNEDRKHVCKASVWGGQGLGCAFSCIQSAILAVVLNRNPSSWKLGWDVHLLSVAYCDIVVTAGMTYWLRVWSIEKKGHVFMALFSPLALLITVIFPTFVWKETLHWGSVGEAVLLVGGSLSIAFCGGRGKRKRWKPVEKK